MGLVAGSGAQSTARRMTPCACMRLNMDRETKVAADRAKGDTFLSIEPLLSEGAVAADDGVHAPAPNEVRPTRISASASESEFGLRVLLSPLFGKDEKGQMVRFGA